MQLRFMVSFNLEIICHDCNIFINSGLGETNMFNSPVGQYVCTFIIASLVIFPVALVVTCKLLV